jgi:hypothetical protein
MGGGGKSSTSTQSVSIPPEVLARYNAVNARAENVAQQPFQQYGGEFVAPLTPTQTAGIESTSAASQLAQPYYGAATQGLLGAQQGGANYIGAATNQLGSAQQTGQALGAAAGQQYAQASGVATPYYQAATQGTQNAVAGAQPYQQAATMAALAGARGVGPGRLETDRYMNPYVGNVVNATQAALGQQFGQQQSQQQAEAIRAGAFGGERAGLQRAQLMGQQGLAAAQAIAPLYQQGYQQALQTAQQQQGVGLGAEQANRAAIQQAGQQLAGLGQQGYSQQLGAAQQMQGIGQGLYGQALGVGQAVQGLGQQQYGQGAQTAQQLAALGQQGYGMGAGTAQQLAGLGTGAQQAALQGAQAQIGAGTLEQQTQQAQNTAQYQQFLQQRGYDFQVAQFLANIAMGTGALSGSTTSTTQPRGFFSNRGGFKTGEGLQRSKKAYGGGLDPNSMGGAVYEPGAFERGGYATAGSVVDPNDLTALLAQQRQAFGPFAAAGPYGQASGATPHGPGGIVPQQQMHVPKLVTAGALPKAAPGAGSDLLKVYGLGDEATKGLSGKGLTERAGEKFGLRNSPEKIAEAKGADMPGASANATTGSQNPSGGVVPTPTPRDPTATAGEDSLLDRFTGLFKADGGGVMPRHHFEQGGAEDSQGEEAIPYDPSDVTGTKDPMEGVLKAGNQKPQMLKPSGGGGGGSGGGGFGDVVNVASKVLPFFLKDGGVVPRQHFEGGGDADLPIDAKIVERTPGLDPNVVSELKREEQASAGIPREFKGVVPQSDHDPDASFNRSVTNLLKREGGLGIDNNGARVNYGFNQASHPDIDVRELTPEKAAQKYRTDYWNAIGGDKLHPDLANVALDTAAMAGPGKANQLLKSSNGDPVEMLNQRHQFLANLVASGDPKYNPNVAKSWQNRYESMMNELGAKPQSNLMNYLPGGSRESQPQKSNGVEPVSFFDRNKGIILPVLQGIGAMASSKSISPFAAALQGLGAGAKAYGDVEAQQAGIEQTKAGTTSALSNIPIGNMIGTFNPETGKIEYRPRPDYFAPNAFPPKKLADAQNEAIRRGQVATGLVKPSMQGGAYTVDVEPGQTANREFSQYGYTGGDKDAYVVPSTIGTQPALAKKAAEDQAAAQKRTEAGAMVPQTRLETNMLVDSVLGISPYGFTGDGPNQSARARAVNLYNWGVKNIFGGPAEIEKENVTSSQIINKLTRQLGAQFAGAAGFHASGLADALKDAQISGELTKEASIKLASSMYVRQQMEEDFSKYYNNYMKKYGTAYNVQNNFAREMGNQYEEEKKSLQRALTPVEKEGKWSSPVMELRKNPALAPQFDAYFKKPGLARMLLGG